MPYCTTAMPMSEMMGMTTPNSTSDAPRCPRAQAAPDAVRPARPDLFTAASCACGDAAHSSRPCGRLSRCRQDCTTVSPGRIPQRAMAPMGNSTV
jgi:hypothetical protein